MLRNRFVHVLALAVSLCTLALSHAGAQDNPEGGDVELNAHTRVSTGGQGSRSGVRLAMQGRLDALNLVQLSRPAGPGGVGNLGAALMSPTVTPGVRLLDARLFLGLGLGFSGVSAEQPDGDNTSRSGFSLVPMATYDLLSGSAGALSLGGMLTIAHLGQTEFCPSGGACMEANDDSTGIGLSALVGLRGFITESLAIGTDFGWGFLTLSSDADDDVFLHGVLGMILIEASLGL